MKRPNEGTSGHPYIFADDYELQAGLVNGKVHYLSTDGVRKVIAFDGSRNNWMIQSERDR